METLREFVEEEEHNNWLKVIVTFGCLLKPLRPLIDERITNFHEELLEICGADQCGNNCTLKNWKPRTNQTQQKKIKNNYTVYKKNETSEIETKEKWVPPLCEVCSCWRETIKENLTGGKMMWSNSEPHLWSRDKWEVAKVYMTDGQKKHKSVDDFDIAALLSLMGRCKFFKRFKLGNSCEQVAKVRNDTMHSADYQLKKEDLHSYLHLIRGLGEALAKHDRRFNSLSEDISVIQNTEFNEIRQKEEITKAQEAREKKEQMRKLAIMIQQLGDKIEEEDEFQRIMKLGPFGRFTPSRQMMLGWNYLMNRLFPT